MKPRRALDSCRHPSAIFAWCHIILMAANNVRVTRCGLEDVTRLTSVTWSRPGAQRSCGYEYRQ